jgi:hypothetical protein
VPAELWPRLASFPTVAVVSALERTLCEAYAPSKPLDLKHLHTLDFSKNAISLNLRHLRTLSRNKGGIPTLPDYVNKQSVPILILEAKR